MGNLGKEKNHGFRTKDRVSKENAHGKMGESSIHRSANEIIGRKCLEKQKKGKKKSSKTSSRLGWRSELSHVGKKVFFRIGSVQR